MLKSRRPVAPKKDVVKWLIPATVFKEPYYPPIYMNILVLCTGNSCRSQMAEGYLKHYLKGRANVFSAGIEAHGLNPKAVHILSEDGIDISTHTSDVIESYSGLVFDLVLTVCDHAQERCPHFPGKVKRIHHNFSDPARASGTEAEILDTFRKVREDIKAFCQQLSESL